MDILEDQLKTAALRRRLGDYLLNHELLSKDQLEEAVEYQCIYGGKLGTSLVELGYINEDKLAQVLSQQLKLHYIKPELLMKVPAEILKLVPQKVALKYKVVPYHLENRRLYLAMSDASNLADIDELSFQLDQVIVPLAIPEIRLMLALKQHYGLALTPRFETLASQLKKRSLAEQKQTKLKPVPVQDNQTEEWPLLGDNSLPEEEYAGAYFTAKTPAAEISATSLCQQLASASDRNDIARALIHYLGQEFSASALFMVRATGISGWMACQKGVELADFHQYSTPLQQQDSVFRMAIENQSHYLGQIPESPPNLKLLQLFPETPPSALVAPLMVRDRVVSILYVQDQLEILEKRFAELQSLVSKAELAFMLLIMKNKILTT